MADRLISAAQSGDITSVRRLIVIEGGTNVNATDEFGKTALHYAAEKNQGAIVDYLLDKGANVNKQDNDGWAALHRAASMGYVNISKSLLAKGANIELGSDLGLTPLLVACGKGYLDVVQYLISEGADINKTSKAGFTPLHFACQEGHIQVADCLLSRGVDVNTAMHDGGTPLHVAAGTKTRGGHLDMVKFLVKRGASINHSNSKGKTALNWASRYGHIDIVKYLIDTGAEFKEGDNEGWTPLHAACVRGHLHVVQLLVSLGADINKLQNDGATPLHVAAWNGRLDTVKYLISKGAGVDKQTNMGNTPLHIAAEQGHSHVVDFLLQDKSKGRPMINQINKAGYTSLHRATQGGHTPVVDVLLSHGADINFLTSEGQSCLHLAAELCNKPDFTVEITNSLTQVASSLPPSPTRDGQALFLYLVQRGADINIKTKGFFRRKTPLDCISDSKLRTTISRTIPTLGKWVPPTTPLEILARGPEAVKAYTEALRTGEKRIYRTRLMLVGQERVGKTSLKKSLTGQKFNSKEPITHGVECKISVDVAQVGKDSWMIQGKQAKKSGDEFKQAIVGEVMKKLKDMSVKDPSVTGGEKEREVSSTTSIHTRRIHSPKETSSLTQREIRSQVSTVTHTEVVRRKTTMASPSIQRSAEIRPDISELLAKEVKSPTRKTLPSGKEEKPSLHIWDFAGHELYYITHQVFMSWRAIYILAFDLSKDLDRKFWDSLSPEEREALGSSHNDLTHLEFIHFWISSLVAHASPPPGREGQISPKIFIVGTHRDSIPGLTDPNKKAKHIDAIFERIQKSIAGKPYNKHVMRPYYAIENSLGAGDPQLKALQSSIMEIVKSEPYWGEKIPLRWLQFEEKKESATNEIIRMDKIRGMTRPLQIGEDLETMLTFYHDLGKIVYFGNLSREKRALNDIVVLDPQMLVNVFKEIITLAEPKLNEQELYDLWDKLKYKGILDGQLINHVWKRFEIEDRQRLLDIMEQFDLICVAPNVLSGTHDPVTAFPQEKTLQTVVSYRADTRNYYVPSLFNPGNVKESEDLAAATVVSFYVDFNGLFTIGLFHRLMSRISQLVGSKAELYYRQIFFPVARNHWVQVEMKPHPDPVIKVTIFPVKEYGATDQPTTLPRPDPNICRDVRHAFCRTLDDLSHDWLGRTIEYVIQFECLKPECNQRHPFDLCYGTEMYHHCSRHDIDLNSVRDMFGIMSHVLKITNKDARVEFNTLQITAVVSPNALPSGRTQLVTITVITDISKYIQKSDDEIFPAFGIQCQPDGLKLKAPITVTIPHCALFERSGDVTPVLYSGTGQVGPGQTVDRTVLPSGEGASSDVIVKENSIELQIDHFSWSIVSFFRRLSGRSPEIKMACFPLMPTCIRKGGRVDLRLNIYKATTGMKEVIDMGESLGYVQQNDEVEFTIQPDQNLYILLLATHNGRQDKIPAAVHYDTLMNLGHVCKTFEIDFRNCECPEGIFHIEIRQEVPDPEKPAEPPITCMKFHTKFEHH